jgi:hypothetical protein
MILSCLAWPARLVGTAGLVGIGYLGWVNRAEIRRWVHQVTAEPAPPPDDTVTPVELRRRAEARLDSLARGRADSVVLTPREVATMVVAEVDRRALGVADSVAVELLDGGVAIRAQVDAARLPKGALGPLAEWVSGRETVAVRGPLVLRRLGTAEWRVDQVTIRGVPLPRGLWERLLTLVVPGASGTLSFPVDRWITGIRVTPAGAVLFGGPAERAP